MDLPILVDAKSEYTKQLISLLTQPIYDGIESIYKDSKKISKQIQRENKKLVLFQEFLSKVPKWNQEIIENEVSRIKDFTQCDWLENLMTAVFISYTKVLTAIGTNISSKKMNIQIPTLEHFIHKCYIEAAREFWKKPYLFYDINVPSIDIQRNRADAEVVITTCIEEAVRKLLPVKSILQNYVSIDNDITLDNVSMISRNEGLKTLVKNELQTITPIKQDENFKDLELQLDEEQVGGQQDGESILNSVVNQVKSVVSQVASIMVREEEPEPSADLLESTDETPEPVVEENTEPAAEETVEPVIEETEKPVVEEVATQVASPPSPVNETTFDKASNLDTFSFANLNTKDSELSQNIKMKIQ